MKRFVLSLVTALSLMGAAQAFAYPVPVVKPLEFSSGNRQQSFAGISFTYYSAPMSTKDMVDPSYFFTVDPSTADGIDSTAVVTIRLYNVPGTTPTTSDSVLFGLQVSQDGANWVTWTPDASGPFEMSGGLGTGLHHAVLDDAGGGHEFYYQIRNVRQATPNGGYDGLLAADVTDARGLLDWPMFRIAYGNRSTCLNGTFQADIRYYTDKAGSIERGYKDLVFRDEDSGVVVDSVYATGKANGTSTIPDTTAAFSLDDLVLPPYAGSVSDTIVFARINVWHTDLSGVTAANNDSLYLTIQVSMGAGAWTTVSEHAIVGVSGYFSFPLVQSLVNGAYAWPNGFLVGPRSGTAITHPRLYGIYPLARIVARRATASAAETGFRASLMHYKFVPSTTE